MVKLRYTKGLSATWSTIQGLKPMWELTEIFYRAAKEVWNPTELNFDMQACPQIRLDVAIFLSSYHFMSPAAIEFILADYDNRNELFRPQLAIFTKK